jgi:hypothetical protein
VRLKLRVTVEYPCGVSFPSAPTRVSTVVPAPQAAPSHASVLAVALPAPSTAPEAELQKAKQNGTPTDLRDVTPPDKKKRPPRTGG